jgi:hypothetical protein
MDNWLRVQLVPSSPTETAMQAAEVAVRLLRAQETDDVGERTVKPRHNSECNHRGHPRRSRKKGQPQHGIRRKLVAMGGNNHQPRKN